MYMLKQHKAFKIKYSLRSTLMILGVAGMFTILPPAVSHAEYDIAKKGQSTTVGGLLTKISLRSALGQGRVEDIKFYDRQAMMDFYNSLGHQTFWIRDDRLHSDARDVFEILSSSWTHGLNPENYHVDELSALLSRDAVTDKARLELLLTDATVRYMRDLSGMRINPSSIKQKAEYWQPQKDINEIYEGLAKTKDVEKYVQSTAPKSTLYTKLQKELVALSKESGAYDHLLPLDFNNNYFKPGEKHKTVKNLRVRMGLEHDPQYGPENYYDDQLASAVMGLQKKHGLETDGIIGPQTLDVLNNSREEQMKQIVANLERLRWLDRDKPDRYILVNIVSQTLWGIDEGRVKLEMPVIVGSPYRKTKSFKTEVQGVRFNPDWTVPLSIKMKDFLPKLQKGGPDYLDYKGIEVIRGYGNNAVTLDPYAIDWSNMSWREMGKLRMVQTPGDHNALGRVRILMPNVYNIYLHDTNHPELFAKSQRTLSSGCIRLSDPKAVARFVLDKNKDWDESDMTQVLSRPILTEVSAAEKMPVYILYQSVWLNDDDQLVYGADVYKRDKELLGVLEAMNGYALPDADDIRFAKIENATELASSRYNE
jgi:murein L,D-transpeptidase YcbB/YkuD